MTPNSKNGKKPSGRGRNQPAGRESGKNQKNPQPQDQNNFQWKKVGKTSLVWVGIILATIFLSNLFSGSDRNEIAIDYYQFKSYLENKEIESGEIIENIFHGKFRQPQTLVTDMGPMENVEKFRVILPFIDRDSMEEWEAAEIKYNFQGRGFDWGSVLQYMLPLLFFIGFWLFLMRRMQGGAGGMSGVFNFGKSKAKLFSQNMPKITFRDVAGCVEAKEELREIVSFLKFPKRYQKIGARIPKGALLVGPPGTGKTLLGRAVAGEADVPFYSLSGAEFVEMFVGVGASRVRDLFEQGKKNAPCLIFIDELDAVGRQRGAGLGGGHDEREQTLNQLLVELDGFEEKQNVIVMAATNRPDVLDAALLRPGRFDRQIVVDVPDLKGRHDILKVHAKNVVMNKRNVDLEELAKGTPGLVGADLANIVNEAALLAARKNKRSVDMVDLEEAKDKSMMGVQRKSLILSEEEKKLTAYHEAGHAIVAAFTTGADPVHKVTIIPRGRALGVTMQLPIDEKHGYAKKYIEGRLAIMMGGRAAEQLIFNELTTGAGNDIEQATNIARKMVCEWGMSDVLGPMTFGKKNEEIFLGREIQSHRDYSEITARQIDEEVVRVVRKAQVTAERLLREQKDLLHKMADALLQYETIDARDIKLLLAGKKVVRARKQQKKYKTRKPSQKPRKVQPKQKPKQKPKQEEAPRKSSNPALYTD